MLKITGLILLAFVLVLGNEIRLGIDRYMKNTLETDAEINVRTLDKLLKEYTDETVNQSLSFQSDKFEEIYSDFLSGDSTLVKSLVTRDGKILDISRETEEDTQICLLVKNFQGKKDWPIYFHLDSMGSKDIDNLENELTNENQEECNVTIHYVNLQSSDETNNELDQIDVAQIDVNEKTIVKREVNGDIQKLSGKASFYLSQYKEIFFSNNSQPITQGNITRIVSENNAKIVIDYHDAMNGVRNQLQNHFKQYIDMDKVFVGTSYGEYYLLEPYRYESKYYSSVLVPIIDWRVYNKIYEETFDEVENDENIIKESTLGYVIITQEYSDLTMSSMQQFMIDNFSTYFLAFLLIICICLIIAYMIIKPIRRIETTAKHIAHKEFDYPIDMTRHDELGDLARSIDIMSKELEKTINDLYQKVEKVKQLENIRKEFVSNFTHEIKTPLGIINGFSELVELEQDEQKRNEYISIIQNETKKINNLVLAMLEYSRLESASIPLKIEEVDMLEVVDEAISSMSFLFQKKNIRLQTSLDFVNIQADRFRMEMLITNFISNAIRYTKEGNTIDIHLDEHTFSIENEGAYIPEEHLEKVWLTFHKVDKARNEEGTGIGLAICRSILELHRFEYGVKNTETGVLFYFHF